MSEPMASSAGVLLQEAFSKVQTGFSDLRP